MTYNISVFRHAAAISLILLAFVWTPAAHAETTALVFPFENETADPNLNWLGEGFAELIVQHLSGEDQLAIFGRDDRLRLYDTLGVPATAVLSRATAMKVAWEAGADVVIIGRMAGTPDDFHLYARSLDVEDARYSAESHVAGKLQDVMTLAATLSWQLAQSIIPDLARTEADYTGRPAVPPAAFEAYVRGILSTEGERRISLLQEAIRLHPDYPAAAYQLGRTWHDQQDFASAAPLLEKIAPGSLEYSAAQFVLGLNAYYLGDHARAASIFSAMDPMYDVLVNLGAALADQDDSAGAMFAWRRATDADPLGADALFNIGYLALTLGRYQEAAEALEKFRQLQGRDAEGLFLLARAYENLGRIDEAQPLAAQASRLSPRIERWRGQPLPKLQRLRNEQTATPVDWTEARLSRRSNGRDLNEWMVAVQEQVESQAYGQAIRELQTIVQVYPGAPEPHLLLAQIYEGQKLNSRALEEYQQSLQLKPSADTYVMLARLYRAMNLPASAAQAIAQALALEPDHAGAGALKADLEGR